MSPTHHLLLLATLLFLVLGTLTAPTPVHDCQVVIAGGSLAALATALASAKNGVQTCLIEPTNWVGGQATVEAVPAVDFAWHVITNATTNQTLNVGQIAKDPLNVTPSFRELVLKIGNPGRCWVSYFCFLPEVFLKHVGPMLREVESKLTVFYNTVPTKVYTSSTRITGLDAVRRTPTPSTRCNGYDKFPSEDLPDWYSAVSSARYTKQVLQFRQAALYVDATEWGELLALSGAPYLQGLDGYNDTCGQAMTYDFIEYLADRPVVEPPNPLPVTPAMQKWYSLAGYDWGKVWTYRRVLAEPPMQEFGAETGDYTVQNWHNGNDDVFDYLFLSINETQQQVQADRWVGGVNLQSLSTAESVAMGWHYAYKKLAANDTVAMRTVLVRQEDIIGTCHGLSKLPYVRDTRRSIGLDNFMVNVSDISGDIAQMTGKVFWDRIAIGAYNIDIHNIINCNYPQPFLREYNVLPFFIPFRAATNIRYENMLVAGKTMAQDFLSNAAIRVHPNEWSSGTGIGVAAAYMVKQNITSTTNMLQVDRMQDLQKEVAKFTPIRWMINGRAYPSQ